MKKYEVLFMRNCKVLFYSTKHHAWIYDPITYYIWVYDDRTNRPIYCFTLLSKIKKFFL